MIAICVGHSRQGDLGAASVDGVSEWHYNTNVAQRVVRMLDGLDLEACVINAYPGRTYSAAMVWLAGELRRIHASCCIELHFNSSDDPKSHGHEWMYWHSSPRGQALARALQGRMILTYPELKSRGLVAVDSEGTRGGRFLRRTPCPAVIVEPFFGTNRGEWQLMAEEREMYAEVLALGIDDWMGGRA